PAHRPRLGVRPAGGNPGPGRLNLNLTRPKETVMQSVTIEGYLAADPSILSAQGSGAKRASFRLIETTRFRRGDGQPGERTTGFNCVCFNEATAENYIAPFAK